MIQEELDELRADHLYRRVRTLGTVKGTHAYFEEKDILLFCSNDYLGMSQHPRVMNAVQRAVSEQGVGAGAARLISGSSGLHAQLEKKIAAFNETDVFLMPSRSDAFGIAYLEAWASGKPVIGANIGATPEVIRDKIDGLFVEFDDYLDIADKVVMLLKKKRLRKNSFDPCKHNMYNKG